MLYVAFFFYRKENIWQKYSILFLPNILFNFHESDALAILGIEYLYIMLQTNVEKNSRNYENIKETCKIIKIFREGCRNTEYISTFMRAKTIYNKI